MTAAIRQSTTTSTSFELTDWYSIAGFLFCCLAALVSVTDRATADKIETGRVIIARTPGTGEPIEAKVGSDGTIHLLYNSKSDGIPYYVTSSDGALTFGSPKPVIDNASRKPGLIFSGDALAVGKRGAVYVATSTNNWKLKLPGVVEGLGLATLETGAKAFTPLRSLNTQPSEGFSLAADESGNVVATWLANKLYVNFSRDGGRTFTPNSEINPSYDPCNCCTTRTVYGPDSSLAVLYREKANDKRDMYLVILKKDGEQVRTRISSTLWEVNACPMTYYGLSRTRNGYIAAWPTKSEIYFARMDTEGRVIRPGEIKTPGRTGTRTGPIALEAPDGTALIAWKHQSELSFQLYSVDGRPEGALSSIQSSGSGVAGVVDKNGKFILFQ
jgi:hypothetical protein